MDPTKRHVLLYTEAESFVTHLKAFKVDEVGTRSWFQQHDWIEKLNMQAIINASSCEDEFIKDLFITLDKMPIVLHDLIVIEVWKLLVFPEILKRKVQPWLSFPVYMVLHHEATVVNLMETILYYEECCEAVSEIIVDLVDYCQRKMLVLITEFPNGFEEMPVDKLAELSTLEHLELQNRDIEFNICLKALSILRYMTDHLKNLPLVVTNRLLNTHDLPMVLVSLIENPPWERQRGNDIQKYINGKWTVIPAEESRTLIKVEGQVWIALFHLLIDPHCQAKYELNNYRKNKILKVRPFMTDYMLDQLPPLVAMRQYFDQLAFMIPSPAKKDLILDQIPEIWSATLKEAESDLDEIVDKHIEILCKNPEGFYDDQAKKWAEIYDMENLEKVIPEENKCALCGEKATKRCSRCHTEWYCKRECQVQHWSKHKKCCDLIVSSKERDQTKE